MEAEGKANTGRQIEIGRHKSGTDRKGRISLEKKVVAKAAAPHEAKFLLQTLFFLEFYFK